MSKEEYINTISETLALEVREPQIEIIYKKLEKHKKKEYNNFEFIDLFAGIGGLRIPFDEAGGKCVFSSEIDPYCQKTYYANFGEIPNGDITLINVDEIPKHDFLIGGFPCQAFSQAGNRLGFEDIRGTLFFNIASILQEHKPRAFLLENVKGLENHDHKRTFITIKSKLEEMGYKLFVKVLNSMTHANVPQNRERIFIVGILEEYVKGEFTFPSEIKLTKTIHDLLDTDKKDDKYYYKKTHPYYSKLDESIISRDTIYQWRRVYVRANKKNVCPTLTANMGAGGHNVPIIRDDFGIRKLTPRECARFQGYDDNFIFPNNISDSKKYHQIGNSVTVPLIRRISKKITEYLEFNNAD